MSIILIRHGQSQANINGRTLSHQTISLTAHGHLQAQALCHQLPAIDHVMVSKYTRTYETAVPLLSQYNLSAEIDEGIHEFSYLSEQRCSNTNMYDRSLWVEAYWEKMDPDYQDAIDAESFAGLYQRVQRFYQRLNLLKAAYQERNLVVFSHGQFLMLFKILMQQQQALSVELMQQFRFNLIHHPIENTEFFLF